jgi:hypothetical protein
MQRTCRQVTEPAEWEVARAGLLREAPVSSGTCDPSRSTTQAVEADFVDLGRLILGEAPRADGSCEMSLSAPRGHAAAAGLALARGGGRHQRPSATAGRSQVFAGTPPFWQLRQRAWRPSSAWGQAPIRARSPAARQSASSWDGTKLPMAAGTVMASVPIPCGLQGGLKRQAEARRSLCGRRA